jgi:hypothetical protein
MVLAIDAVQFFELVFGPAGTDFKTSPGRNAPEKVSGQIVRGTLAIRGYKPEVPAKIAGGLHQVSRHPAGKAVLAEQFHFAHQQFRGNIRG